MIAMNSTLYTLSEPDCPKSLHLLMHSACSLIVELQ